MSCSYFAIFLVETSLFLMFQYSRFALTPDFPVFHASGYFFLLADKNQKEKEATREAKNVDCCFLFVYD